MSASSVPARSWSVTAWLNRASATPMRRPVPLGVACRCRGTDRRSALALQPGQEMAELRLLGAEVLDVPRVRGDLERRARDDVDPVALEAADLLRVVREEADAAHAEVAEDLCADAVVAQILAEAELEVRLDRVEAAVLERVRADLVGEADPASLLVEVDEHAAPRDRHRLDRLPQLIAAVAALRAEDVAGETLGVETDEHLVVALHVAQNERHVVIAVDRV